MTAIAVRAKASWGYPADWIDDWRGELAVTADYIREHPVFAAETDARIVGLASLEMAQLPAQIGYLWVEPAFHRHGVGRALVAHCIDQARIQRLDQLLVESDPHAAEFYRRLGAEPVDSVPAPLPGLPDRVLPILRFALD